MSYKLMTTTTTTKKNKFKLPTSNFKRKPHKRGNYKKQKQIQTPKFKTKDCKWQMAKGKNLEIFLFYPFLYSIIKIANDEQTTGKR